MSRVGSLLAEYDGVMAEWFEGPVEVTNYYEEEIESDPDEFDSVDEKTETEESPIEATAQIDPLDATAENTPWGREVDGNVEIWISDVTISDGTVDGLPYPSDVKDLDSGQKYRIVEMIDEGQGTYRCLGTTVGS